MTILTEILVKDTLLYDNPLVKKAKNNERQNFGEFYDE